MIPVLYPADEYRFLNNGIGRLSELISCSVIEERNGIYELSAKYPITGKYYNEIAEDRIIYAAVNDSGNRQAFRIYKVSRPINGVVTINAEHISYLLNKSVVMPFSAGTAAEAMLKLKTYQVLDTPFNFSTDVTTQASLNVTEPRNVRELLGGSSGSVLQAYGGEYEFNNFDVILHKNRGTDSGVTLRYGKNITDLNRTTDMTNTYVGIVPFWSNGESIVTLPEKAVLSDYADKYAYKIIKAVDFSQEWQNIPTEAQLRARAVKYISSNEGWLIKDNIKVSFVNLRDTEEYKDIAPLERVSLCDRVTVIYNALGVSATAKVVKTDFDVLSERYNSIEIGEASNSLGKTLSGDYADSILSRAASHMERAVTHATNVIQGGLGGYVIFNTDSDKHPNEILIMNTPDKETATQVLRINLNGIGFGKGYNGPFDTAWTLDGHFVADYIDTGNLNASLLTVGVISDRAGNMTWNIETGAITAKKFSLNSTYFKISETGVITATSGTIGGLTFDSGSIKSTNGDWQINADGSNTLKHASISGHSTYGSSVSSPFSGTTVSHIETIAADYIETNYLRAIEADIGSLQADVASVNSLVATKASIEELNAVNAKFNNLDADNITTGSIDGDRIEIYNARLKGSFTSISGDFVWKNHNIGTTYINGKTVLCYDDD